MFYKTDFIKNSKQGRSVNTANLLKGSNFLKHKQIITISGKVNDKETIKLIEASDGKEFNNRDKLSLWERYCVNTTIHGIRYTSNKELHWFERLTWIILVIAAIIGIAYFSFLISKRFSSSPLSTVIESIIYPVSEISYPAVTLCNYHRINWLKLKEAENLFLPKDVNNETIDTFSRLVMALEVLEFGAFEQFEPILNRSLKELEHINITKLFEIVMPNCDDLFVEPCWWRNKYLPCCSIFFKQKSEYGMCYSFNSLTSYGHENISNSSKYPWRTSNYGDWSGLRVTVKTKTEQRIPASINAAGFLIMVHDPKQWPNSANFIPVGTTTSVILKPIYSYATSGVNRLDMRQRNCILPQEENSTELFNLPGLTYLRANCISECRQRNMITYCNCTAGFMFPIGNYTDCNISGMVCANQYDSILNYEKPPPGNPFFSSDEEGMVCPCLPECNRINYDVDISTIVLTDSDRNSILFDIHFQYATMVKYRTDVIFGWLDLVVAFGGIAGLFLGSSLLSIVEIFYFLIYIVFMYTYTVINYYFSRTDPKEHKIKPTKIIAPFSKQKKMANKI